MIQIIGIAILAWMFADGFEPIQIFKHIFLIDNPDDWSGVMHWLVKLINCSLCVGFWSGLIITEDIYTAAITSVLAEAVSRINKSTIIL